MSKDKKLEKCRTPIYYCQFVSLCLLQPSEETFKKMYEGLKTKENRDGADQGYLMAWFDDLLQRPLFIPPANGSKVDGYYRLPLGYQMDASYYCELRHWQGIMLIFCYDYQNFANIFIILN